MTADVHVFREVSEKGLVRSIDARLKAALGAGLLALCLMSTSYLTPIFIGGLCLFLTMAAGTRLSAMSLRLAFPLLLALSVSVMRAPFAGGDIIAVFSLFGHAVTIGADSITEGLQLVSTVFGAVSSMLFVTMTTPVRGLLSAASWFRMPSHLVEILMLSYRYVFLLLDDANTVRNSQTARLGYSGLRTSMRSLGTLSGAVLLRAFNQAEATSAAMTLRGYTGSYLPQPETRPLRFSHAALLLGIFAASLTVYLWT